MTQKARAVAARVGIAAAGALIMNTGSSAVAAPSVVAGALPLAATSTAAGVEGRHCAADLGDRISRTGLARQLLTVEAAGLSSAVATFEMWQRDGSCWQAAGGPWTAVIGRNGFSDHHREGDGTTPTGIYGIGPEIYGNAPNPGTAFPYHTLVCGDWWDEDSTSTGYNTFEHVPCGQSPPFGGASEALWTEMSAYPSFAVIEYNAHPVIAYAGSAIFLHAAIGVPTAGCVALPLAELDRVLRWLVPDQRPAIVLGPAAEITRF
jgi:L,D-peptidoglycan transpeptidase YkuD (ErfK/YbiS/YcfS/YnhG family)